MSRAGPFGKGAVLPFVGPVIRNVRRREPGKCACETEALVSVPLESGLVDGSLAGGRVPACRPPVLDGINSRDEFSGVGSDTAFPLLFAIRSAALLVAVSVMVSVFPMFASAALVDVVAPSGIRSALIHSGRLRRLRRLGGGNMGV